MNNSEFVKKLGELYGYDNVYVIAYRNKNISEYIEEVRKNKEEPILDVECVEFFKDLELDISDNFTVSISSMGSLHKSEKGVFCINISKNNELIYHILFDYNIENDEQIELLINSICKAMYLKCYRYVNVEFSFIVDREVAKKFNKDLRELI